MWRRNVEPAALTWHLYFTFASAFLRNRETKIGIGNVASDGACGVCMTEYGRGPSGLAPRSVLKNPVWSSPFFRFAFLVASVKACRGCY